MRINRFKYGKELQRGHSGLMVFVGLLFSLDGLSQPFILNERHLIDDNVSGVFYALEDGDIDSDGDIDLVAGSGSDILYWYENDGNQNFTRHTILQGIDDPREVIILDLDLDGDIDLATASRNDDAIRWFENDGNQNFTVHLVSNTANGAVSVFAGDFDNDGDYDLGSVSIYDDDLVWYENDGQELFTKRVINASLSNPYTAVANDLDQNGEIDIIVGNNGVLLWYKWNAGNWTYQSLGSASAIDEIEVADMDNDGDLDVVTTASYSTWATVHLFRNNGSQTFAREQITNTGRFYGLETGDFNFDGSLDMATNNYENRVTYYLENNNNGYFGSQSISSYSSAPYAMAATDLDGDGDTDLATIAGNDLYWMENHTDPIINPEADLLSFSFPGQFGETQLDQSNKTVEIDFLDTADLSSQVATFTLSDTANAYVNGVFQQSGVTANNFTNPVTYNVYAADSSTINDYVVTATVLSSKTDVLSYSVPGELAPLVIDDSLKTITGSVSSLSSDFIATFTISAGASISVSGLDQVSGITSNNYNAPLVYQITSEDGLNVENWTVDVQILSPQTDITSFSLPGSIGFAQIDQPIRQVNLNFSDLVDRSSLIATFELSPGATASISGVSQQSGVTANDFTGTVIYDVLAEDGVTSQSWTINITTLSSATDCNSFTLPGSLGPGVIDNVSNTITFDFLDIVDRSALVAEFDFTPGASVYNFGLQTSGLSINDFRSGITHYTVYAEDGITTEDWSVVIHTVSVCEHLAGMGLNCDVSGSTLNVDSALQGNGLVWNNEALDVLGYDSLQTAYNERGSVVAGSGLVWNGEQLDLLSASYSGHGLTMNGTSLEIDGSVIISRDFEWDSLNHKINLSESYSSLFQKIDDSSIYFSGPQPESTKVGIGTSYIPDGYMMAIDGGVIADEMVIKLPDDWPDYVFEEGYDLMSLDDLATYIKQNGHLPGMPAASEVEHEGINLGRINSLMLKKIEELTIYSIKQNKMEKDNMRRLRNLEVRMKKLLEGLK